MKKYPTSIRLSQEAKALLEKLVAHFGISRTDVLDPALRSLARQERLIR